MPQQTTPWDNAKLLDRFVNLHESPEKYSFSVIARKLTEEFPFAFSRSSCIGKARRLALPQRGKVLIRQEQKHRTHMKKPASSPSSLFEQATDSNGVLLEPLHLSLLELRTSQCRFPFGHFPRLTFCGLRRRPGSPYCPKHHAVTHVANSTES